MRRRRSPLDPDGLARYSMEMTQRTRKFIGTFATVFYLAAYSLIMMALGGTLVVGRGILYELPFYIVAGFMWIPGAMALIKWMAKPDTDV